MKEKLKKSAELFLFFAKIGCFTFGGGWGILAQMEQEFIQKKNMISKQELLDIVSVGRSVPGIMITNVSVVFGYRIAGICGAIASLAGMVFPSIVILTIVTYLYDNIKDNVYVGYALEGIRSAVVPIIFSSVVSMGKTAWKDRFCYLVTAIAFALSLFSGLGSITIVLLGVLTAVIRMGVCKDERVD